MNSLNQLKYSFIGGGIISGVFIERMIKSGITSPEKIFVSDVKKERLQKIKQLYGIQVTDDNCKCVEFGDVIFLAIPPSQIKIFLSESCKNITDKQIVISLAAAIPTWLIESVLCKEIPIVRVIPNTPSLVGEGMNPYVPGKYVTDEQLILIENLLSVFGKTIHVIEEKMNVITSITSIGPNYIFPIIKTIKDFAIKNGLEEKLTAELIHQTIYGTTLLFKYTGEDPDELNLMIETRTIDENEVKSVFTAALEKAYRIIQENERKLTE